VSIPLRNGYRLYKPSSDRISQSRVGRVSHFRPRDDEFLLSRCLVEPGTHNKKLAQASYDRIVHEWHGSREPTDEKGEDLPLDTVVQDDWPHWRKRSLLDLCPPTFNGSACKFHLNENLSSLTTKERLGVQDARKEYLKIFRQVCSAGLLLALSLDGL
jgi:hypothetical protein